MTCTLAAGTTAPAESMTRPLIVPRSIWHHKGNAANSKRRTGKMPRKRLRSGACRFIVFMDWLLLRDPLAGSARKSSDNALAWGSLRPCYSRPAYTSYTNQLLIRNYIAPQSELSRNFYKAGRDFRPDLPYQFAWLHKFFCCNVLSAPMRIWGMRQQQI